uniref:Uncharacterized protein n=1 Tax=Theropithecus gelada TaxID=9565 RepID=A0A8D2K882_THEGE
VMVHVCNPTTREAEAGELLEPGRQRLREPRLHHCTPAWATKAKLHLDNNNNNNNNNNRKHWLLFLPSEIGRS